MRWFTLHKGWGTHEVYDSQKKHGRTCCAVNWLWYWLTDPGLGASLAILTGLVSLLMSDARWTWNLPQNQTAAWTKGLCAEGFCMSVYLHAELRFHFVCSFNFYSVISEDKARSCSSLFAQVTQMSSSQYSNVKAFYKLQYERGMTWHHGLLLSFFSTDSTVDSTCLSCLAKLVCLVCPAHWALLWQPAFSCRQKSWPFCKAKDVECYSQPQLLEWDPCLQGHQLKREFLPRLAVEHPSGLGHMKIQSTQVVTGQWSSLLMGPKERLMAMTNLVPGMKATSIAESAEMCNTMTGPWRSGWLQRTQMNLLLRKLAGMWLTGSAFLHHKKLWGNGTRMEFCGRMAQSGSRRNGRGEHVASGMSFLRILRWPWWAFLLSCWFVDGRCCSSSVSVV